MAAELKTVNIKIVASGAGVKKGTDEAKGHLNALTGHVNTFSKTVSTAFGSFASGAGGIGGGLGALFGGFGAGVGISAGIGMAQKGLDLFIKTAEDAVDIANKAETVGFSRATLEGIQGKAPGQFESIIGAAEKYNALIGSAAAGNEEARKTLAKFGLEWQKLIGMAPEKAMGAAFDKIRGMPDKFAQSSALRELMGRGGVDILRTAQKGGGVFDEFAKWAIEVGDPHTQAELEKAKRHLDEWRKFTAKWTNFLEDIAMTAGDVLETGIPVGAKTGGGGLRFDIGGFGKLLAKGAMSPIGVLTSMFGGDAGTDQIKQRERAAELKRLEGDKAARLAEAQREREKTAEKLEKARIAPFEAIEKQFGKTEIGRARELLTNAITGLGENRITPFAAGSAGLSQIAMLESRLGLSSRRGDNLADAVESGSVQAASVINRAMGAGEEKSLQERLIDVNEAIKQVEQDAANDIKEMLDLMKKGNPILAPANVF